MFSPFNQFVNVGESITVKKWRKMRILEHFWANFRIWINQNYDVIEMCDYARLKSIFKTFHAIPVKCQHFFLCPLFYCYCKMYIFIHSQNKNPRFCMNKSVLLKKIMTSTLFLLHVSQFAGDVSQRWLQIQCLLNERISKIPDVSRHLDK